MTTLEARAIVECSVEKPALAYVRCDICAEKQTYKVIEVRPVSGVIDKLSLCGKCANRLVWILPRLVAMVGGRSDDNG
jgi:hypothetical protein